MTAGEDEPIQLPKSRTLHFNVASNQTALVQLIESSAMSTSQIGIGLSNANLTSPATFIAWNWFHAYCVLSSRSFKQYYGIDNNASPRQDLRKYGDAAVREGKLTQAQLDQIHRVEAANANSTEGFILFTASGESLCYL